MKKFIILGILLLGVVLAPVAAHRPPTCPPGEVWGVTVPGHWVWGECQSCPTSEVCTGGYANQPHWKTAGYHDADACHDAGHSHSWCNAVDHHVCQGYSTVYSCHEGNDYQFCGENQEQHGTWVPDEYGCVAVSCPAIPCDTGYECVESQCVLSDPCKDVVCEDYQICYQGECIGEPPGPCDNIQCQEGYSCVDGECVPIPECVVDEECKGGYVCVDNECVPKHTGDGFRPYTESACQDIVGSQRPMDDINPETLPLLPLHDTYIAASFKYASQFDCVDLAFYTRGEPSYNADCSEVDYWNSEQTEVHSYGSLPILYAPDPSKAICVLAVKNSPGETSLPVEITLTDSFGTKIPSIVSTDSVISQCYRLSEDFDGCRMRNTYIQFSPWVGK